jgi:hypothetical protein
LAIEENIDDVAAYLRSIGASEKDEKEEEEEE